METIRWAPKVSQNKIRALYRWDALGLPDEDLLAQVGYALLARCTSILMIRDGKAACPRCGAVFQALVEGASADTPVPCPAGGCGWAITPGAYRQSYRHRELWLGKAGPAFEEYAARFPRAGTPQERMLAIDRLLHAFHWDLEAQLPNRPAANNLIEGSVAQVLALLETLTYGDDEAAKAQWRETVRQMMARRRGNR